MRRARIDEGGWQQSLSLVSHESRKGFSFGQGMRKDYWLRVRIRVLWAFLVVAFTIVVTRLLYLQVFEGDRNLLVAQSNRIENMIEKAPRGVVYDKNGVVLVRNVEDDKYGVTRQYVLGPASAHLLGYVSEVKEEELGCRGGLCYEPGTLIGRSGVEQVFEGMLRGRDGGRLLEVDSMGKEVREIGNQDSEAGADIYLSVDSMLQKSAYKALDGRKGSVVVLDMQGRVLALVSSPAYDPNLFTVNKDSDLLNKMLTDDEEKYFLDRAISGTYPPGSVYKLVTAYAGLEEGVIEPDTEIEDTGEITIDQYRYGNWYFDQYGRTEGFINVVDAIKRSNDIFFYKTGEAVGVNKLVEWSKRLGLGEKTGIEIPGEASGLVPDPLWRERYIGEKWFLGNTYHMAIGQGDLLTSPIQIARMTLAALSGRLCDVTVLKDGEINCKEIGIESEDMGVVWEGMKEACQSGGTAYPFFDFNPYVVCKTGTAQHGGEDTKPHAWITMGYPGENPEMVVTVMLEEAGEGSDEAAPVAKKILEDWKKLN